jgi:hypothetical protein
VESLITIGKSEVFIKQDLEEFLKQIAFNVAVNIDDDHPKNYGVLYTSSAFKNITLFAWKAHQAIPYYTIV